MAHLVRIKIHCDYPTSMTQRAFPESLSRGGQKVSPPAEFRQSSIDQLFFSDALSAYCDSFLSRTWKSRSKSIQIFITRLMSLPEFTRIVGSPDRKKHHVA